MHTALFICLLLMLGSQEPDFEEDELVYDDLNLEEEEEMYNVGTEEHFVSEGTSL